MDWADEYGILHPAPPPDQGDGMAAEQVRRLVTRACVRHADGDLDSALEAADVIFSTQPAQECRRIAEGERMQATLSVLDGGIAALRTELAPALATARIRAALGLDAQGHEHRGKGPGGGQFVGKGDAHAIWKAETERLEKEHDQAMTAYAEASGEWEQRGEERRQKMDALSSTDFTAEANDPAEQSLIGQAPQTIGYYGAETEDTPDGREAYRELVADHVEATSDAWESAFGKEGTLRDSLAEAGASDKDLARLAALGEKGKAAIEKAGQKWQAAIDQHIAHKEKMEAVGPEPVEPDLPETPDELDPDDPDITPQEREANAAEWKQYEADQEKYEKDYAAWEKAHDKWDKQTDALNDRDNELTDQADERLSDVDTVWSEHKEAIEEAVTKITDRLYERLEAEDESDEEPQEPDEPDYPDEPEEEEEEPDDESE